MSSIYNDVQFLLLADGLRARDNLSTCQARSIASRPLGVLATALGSAYGMAPWCVNAQADRLNRRLDRARARMGNR